LIDEPLERGATLTTGGLSKYCTDVVIASAEITILGPLLSKLTPRYVETSSEEPLVINGRWSTERKLRYLYARKANAGQIYAARKRLRWSQNRAFAINLQRALECCDFEPRRQWQYYPVVDELLGTGVPRSQAGLSALAYPEVAFMGYSGQLLCSQGSDTIYRLYWGNK